MDTQHLRASRFFKNCTRLDFVLFPPCSCWRAYWRDISKIDSSLLYCGFDLFGLRCLCISCFEFFCCMYRFTLQIFFDFSCMIFIISIIFFSGCFFESIVLQCRQLGGIMRDTLSLENWNTHFPNDLVRVEIFTLSPLLIFILVP